MNKARNKWITVCLFVGCGLQIIFARPAPKEIFREYIWDPGRVRVGVKWDQTNHGEKVFSAPSLDLQDAVRAEAEIQKVLCHDGTTGLSLKMNGKSWLAFPPAAAIPQPQENYQHMTYPNVEIPLDHLKNGDNTFQLKVDLNRSFNQNLIYGIVFRIYYSAEKAHTSGTLTSPKPNSSIGLKADFSVSVDGNTKKVEYIGLYRDFNWEGDGVFTQWHYHFFHKDLKRHIGTSSAGPDFACTWNTAWIPDQPSPMKFMANIHGDNGIIFTTPAVEDVRFDRGTYAVELCTTYNVPEKWVTRKGSHSCNFDVSGNLSDATDAKMVFCSWSPGYANGIGVNGQDVIKAEGPKYECYWHEIPTPVSFLQQGKNTAFTNKTPKHNGKTVHGMEVNWPGICVLIQYASTQVSLRDTPDKHGMIDDYGASLQSPWEKKANGSESIQLYSITGRRVRHRFSPSHGGAASLLTQRTVAGIYVISRPYGAKRGVGGVYLGKEQQ